MKAVIQNLRIPEGYKKADGLPEVNFEGLKEVVALTGPNGAGKSRILDKVLDLEKALLQGAELDREINNYRELLASAISHPISKAQVETRLPQLIAKRALIPSANLSSPSIKTVKFHAATTLSKVGEMREQQFINFAKNRHTLERGAGNGASTVQIVASIHREYMSVRQPEADISDDERLTAEKRFNALESLVAQLLRSKITQGNNFQTKLFGLPLDEAGLSSGQIRLLHFCTSLFEHTESDADLVVLLDEPENHLHPEGLITLVDLLREALPNGQLWIATHSVPLLAHLGQDYIWSVKDGRVERAGRRTREVLVTLMGGEDNVEKLASFLQEPLLLAANTFAWEALSPPNTVALKQGDPQGNQIVNTLRVSWGTPPFICLIMAPEKAA